MSIFAKIIKNIKTPPKEKEETHAEISLERLQKLRLR